MTAPNRRWFRFSLRTMFVMVTAGGLLAGWLVYELNWIRQRHAFLAKNEALRLSRVGVGSTSESDLKAPGLLWLFGETGNFVVVCVEGSSVDSLTEADLETIREAKRLFPEALSPMFVEHVGSGGNSFSFQPDEILAQ